MPRVARKITIGKWRGLPGASPTSIPADVLAIDLRTQSNTLSFWAVNDDQSPETNDALLAIAGSLTSLEAVDIVFLDEAKLNGITLDRTKPGSTAATSLRSTHVDAADLNHSTLLDVAVALADLIYSAKTIRLTKKTLKDMLRNALDRGDLDANFLPPKIQAELNLPLPLLPAPCPTCGNNRI